MIDELGLQGLQGVGGVSYIMQVVGSVPTIANFAFYQKMVLEYAQKRKAIQIAEKIIESARNRYYQNIERWNSRPDGH